MGFLTSIEVPLVVLIITVSMISHSYYIVHSILEAETILNKDALPLKDILIVALAIMAFFGILSQNRFLGAFTLAFMIFNFFRCVFSLIHLGNFIIRSLPSGCNEIHMITREMKEMECWIVNAMLLSLGVVAVIATAVAVAAVYERLTVVNLPINDGRYLATRRRLTMNSEASMPVLVSSRLVVSPKSFEAYKIFSPRTDYQV